MPQWFLSLFLSEPLRGYSTSLQDTGAWQWVRSGVFLVLVVVACLPYWRRLATRHVALVGHGLGAIFVGVGLVYSLAWSWLPDETFGWLSAAQRPIRAMLFEAPPSGLYAAALAGLAALGVPLTAAARSLGLCGFVAAVAVVWWLSGRDPIGRRGLVVSGAAVALVGNDAFLDLAGSGLPALLVGALLLLACARIEAGAWRQAAALATTAALIDADGSVAGLAVLAMVLVCTQTQSRRILAGSSLVVVAVWFLFTTGVGTRAAFLGSAHDTDAPFRLSCLWSAWLGSGWLVLLMVGFLASLVERTRRLHVCVAVVGVSHCLYVVVTGGDFSDGRRTVILLPLFAVVAAATATSLLARRSYSTAALALLGLATLVIPSQLLPLDGPHRSGSPAAPEGLYSQRVAAERRACEVRADRIRAIYRVADAHPVLAVDCAAVVGCRLRTRAIDTRPAAGPCPICSPRNAFPPTSQSAILDAGVDLADVPVFPGQFQELTEWPVRGGPVFWGRYRPEFVRSLLPPWRERASQMEGSLPLDQPGETPSQQACNDWFVDRFYLDFQEPALRQRLIERRRLDPIVKAFLAEGFGAVPKHWTRTLVFGFDELDRPGWLRTGGGLANAPTLAPVPGQGGVTGQNGPYINTFTQQEADRARGTLQSPPFRLVGDIMTLRIGGGLDPALLRVDLLVDGAPVHSATGCGSETLRRETWNMQPYRGREARLLIVDQSAGGWGHLLVDEVEQWSRQR